MLLFLFQCTFLLLLVFLLQATVGIISTIYKEQVSAELNASLPTTFIEKYQIDEAQTKAIDSVQREVTYFLPERITP